MSVQSEIDRISANIAGAYSAVADMGGALPEEQVSDNLEAAVRSIPAGGSGGFSITLGQLPEGGIIELNEGGDPVEFYILKHNYEPELNGEGRTLLMRRDQWETSRPWSTTGYNAYAASSIDEWLNGDYKALLDTDIRQKIGATTFYYTPIGGEDIPVSTLTRGVFLLSAYECGITFKSNAEGSPIASIDRLRFGTRMIWSRSPYLNGMTTAAVCFSLPSNGDAYPVTTSFGTMPCFTLPSDYVVYGGGDSDNGGDSINTYSLEETRIGTWINGKPLYRRVYTGTAPSTLNTVKDLVTIANLDEFVYACASNNVPYGSEARRYCPAQSIKILRVGTKNKISIICEASEAANKSITVILEYTKTTD